VEKDGEMTDILETFKTVLERDTGFNCYPEKSPIAKVSDAAFLRVQRIYTSEELALDHRWNFHKDRIQVTCVARTRTDLMTLIDLMEISLYFNHTDFSQCLPLEGSREAYDGVYFYQKDFWVWY
jgi:hypothetical protein